MTYVLTKVDIFFSKVHFDLSLNFVVEEATGEKKQSDICTRSSIGFTPSSAEYRKLYKANRGGRRREKAGTRICSANAEKKKIN